MLVKPVAASAFALVVLAANVARAEDPSPARCSEAYVAGQHLMHDEKLVEAERELLVCARAPCPSALQPECAEWLADVQREMPSIVVAVKSSKGEDLRDVRVTLDGAAFVDKLDGAARDVDPGDHTLRFEAPGEASFEERVLVRASEKARLLSYRFPSSAPPLATAATASPEPSSTSGPSRAPAFVFAGLAVAATGTFAALGVDGLSRWNACHEGCSASHDAAGNREWVAADVALGVAVASIGLSTYFFLRGAPSAKSSARLVVSPTLGGATLRGAFR